MELTVRTREVPFAFPYTYARGHDLSCSLVQVEVSDEGFVGRGEGAPFESFFDHSADSVVAQLEGIRTRIEQGVRRSELSTLLPPGPARNAVDAALWDLEAKQQGSRVWRLLDLPEPVPLEIMATISLAGREQFLRELQDTSTRRKLKLKLGSDDDIARLETTRKLRPDAELVVDVNSGWDLRTLTTMLPILQEHDVSMIEQPVAARYEDGLRDLPHSVPFIADESFASEEDLPRVRERYDGVNVKLDKCGGLSAALRIIGRAQRDGLRIMVGCLPGSSLSAAVGFHAAARAEFVDLDGHLWLVEDTQPAMACDNGWLRPPTPELWG
ncbi:dipeptide epimerase [Streptomyces sp. SID3343]|uniref:enolase C-terminal domain-like protein n=1 Tax=Streptomyces sp. SID3343 TaxID=2690260 RepID=UPI001367EFD9|nr:dipeptide epimerase [Streptomyces sp. SID3343]